jgi:hypothetical protein
MLLPAVRLATLHQPSSGSEATCEPEHTARCGRKRRAQAHTHRRHAQIQKGRHRTRSIGCRRFRPPRLVRSHHSPVRSAPTPSSPQVAAGTDPADSLPPPCSFPSAASLASLAPVPRVSGLLVPSGLSASGPAAFSCNFRIPFPPGSLVSFKDRISGARDQVRCGGGGGTRASRSHG